MLNIGGGGGGSEYCGGGGQAGAGARGGGGKLFAGCTLIGAPPQSVPNHCIFHIEKTDNIAKLRTELKSILLEIPSNKIKGIYIKLEHL